VNVPKFEDRDDVTRAIQYVLRAGTKSGADRETLRRAVDLTFLDRIVQELSEEVREEATDAIYQDIQKFVEKTRLRYGKRQSPPSSI
jgi:hypothetical protein